TQLTDNTSDDYYPSFSRDGSKIAFVSNRDGNDQIYVMGAVPGAIQSRLTNNTSDNFSPSFSGDGSKIAFASNRDGNSEIYVMNADGSNQTRLSNNAVFDFAPSFGGCAQQLPVIFIHGVAGSRLVDGPPDGNELWLGPLSNRRRLNLF